MKEIAKNATVFGLVFIGLFLCIGTGFFIAILIQRRKHKREIKNNTDKPFNVPYEVERYLHFQLEPEQVN